MTSSMLRLASALSDRYRLERELGQGGMATVYLAHDLTHNRDVAIKVLHDDVAASVGRDRFLREIQLCAPATSVCSTKRWTTRSYQSVTATPLTCSPSFGTPSWTCCMRIRDMRSCGR